MPFPAALRLAAVLVGLSVLFAGAPVPACTMCEPVRDTLSDRIRQAAVTIVAEVGEPAADGRASPAAGSAAGRTPEPTGFRVIRCLSGCERLTGEAIVRVACQARPRPGTRCLLIGSGSPVGNWTEPVELTGQAEAYLDRLPHAPREPAERLAFFLPYTDSSDALVATDAYAEFARAPFADYVAIRSRLDRSWLFERIRTPDTPTYRRTLYLMLLGACGTPEDASRLAEVLKRREASLRPSLHAAIACYLKLAGTDGVSLIETLFLADPAVPWADTYAAIIAIRYCGEEFDMIPRTRLLQAFRRLLPRSDCADFVIADFARWEDWSLVDPLSAMFRELPDAVGSDRATGSIRSSIVQYLHACPLPEATASLEELRRIAPETVRDAEAMYALNWGGAAQTPAGMRGSAAAGLQRSGVSAREAARAVAVIPWETLRSRLLLGAGVLLVYLAGVAIAGLAARPREAGSGHASNAAAGSDQDTAKGLP